MAHALGALSEGHRDAVWRTARCRQREPNGALASSGPAGHLFSALAPERPPAWRARQPRAAHAALGPEAGPLNAVPLFSLSLASYSLVFKSPPIVFQKGKDDFSTTFKIYSRSNTERNMGPLWGIPSDKRLDLRFFSAHLAFGKWRPNMHCFHFEIWIYTIN